MGITTKASKCSTRDVLRLVSLGEGRHHHPRPHSARPARRSSCSRRCGAEPHNLRPRQPRVQLFTPGADTSAPSRVCAPCALYSHPLHFLERRPSPRAHVALSTRPRDHHARCGVRLCILRARVTTTSGVRSTVLVLRSRRSEPRLRRHAMERRRARRAGGCIC